MTPVGIRVALAAYEGVWASTLHPTADILQSVNLRQLTDTFSLKVVTPTEQSVVPYSGQRITGDATMMESGSYDWVVLPHFWGDFDRALQVHPQIAHWLLQQNEAGALIASVNSGAFWAAQAGLLRDRRATAYWRHIPALKQRFPDVDWLAQQGLVEDGGIYTSNGQNAGMDLAMHLVERTCGAEMANSLARDITFDIRRHYDLTLFNMAGFRHHRDDNIHHVQDWLDRHFAEAVSFQVLACNAGMSKSTFLRRFERATGEKPARYLQRLRIEAAKHRLINSDDNIKTISINVGYRDFSSFSKAFKSVTTHSPKRFRSHCRPR
ncbi:helix-turn-helix domain-containing protein [uncultured Zhongshania sp.]|jgi:transcriptional regulator GlxA family with amidase domain|uniref:GlxA family transcriptional regulator n=1 Tax=uncultured Zhongshania sp. TaxID=1642288 RepID=UPI001B593723|nr:helix-turn-helix domain-containing protein [uncultured Zhongshania sp.]MBQ0758797.1 helix-turn-helix domain-containing protein [Zhongshania sp.]